MKHITYIALAALAALLLQACSGSKGGYESTKRERNLIKAGNKEFVDSNYVHAMQLYGEALAAAPGSEPALFNQPTALAAFAFAHTDETQRDSLVNMAIKQYENRYEFGASPVLKEMAAYNIGNIYFAKGNFGESINWYKKALRLNPDNKLTRDNLLVAIIKQQNDDQGGGGSQQEQEQEEEPQQQQQQQEQEQQQQEMSANADQILQTMQNRENQTREDANKKPVATPRSTDKPW